MPQQRNAAADDLAIQQTNDDAQISKLYVLISCQS